MDEEEYARAKAKLQAQLVEFDPAVTYELLADLASAHTETGVLRPMAYDATKPYHRLENVFFPATPIANANLAPYGPAAHSAFPVIQEAWHRERKLLSVLAAMYLQGMNFALVTNHSNIIDIALVVGALRLEIEPWLPADVFASRTTLVISRGIASTQASFPGLGTLPTLEVIQLMCNVATSFPTTTTVRRRSFPPELVRASNELTKLEIQYQRSQPGGQVLAVAPSASRDRFLHIDRLARVVMQPLKNGTMDMMQGLVIPVAVILDPPHGSPKSASCTILEPTYCTSYSDCHQLMSQVALMCHEKTLVPHEYHSDPTLYDQLVASVARNRGRRE